jgi:hypothetical protein
MLRRIKPPAKGAVDYFNDLTPGLSLRVTANDSAPGLSSCHLSQRPHR